MRLFALFCLLLAFGQSLYAQDCTGQRYRELIFPTFSKEADVVFGQNKDMDGVNVVLKMDVYQPDGDTEAKRPLLVLMHGGGFVSNGKKSNEVVPLCEKFARMGFVTASIDYRLVPISVIINQDPKDLTKAGIMAMQDAKAAIRFFRKSAAEGNPYKIDSNIVLFGGSSAGGFTALHLAYLHTEAEFLLISDAATLAELGGLEGASGNPGYSSAIGGAINLCGGLPTVKWINAGEPPVISMHGTSDQASPYKRGKAQSFVQFPSEGSWVVDSAAKAQGLASELYTFPGAGHTPYVTSPTDETAPVVQTYADTTFRFLRDKIYFWLCHVNISARENNLKAAEFVAYPNPAADRLNVEWAEATGNADIQLIDAQGRLVFSDKLNAKTTSFDCSRWPRGVYLLQIVSGESRLTKKIVLE